MTTLFDGLKNYEANLTFSEQQSCFEYKLLEKDTTITEFEDENGNTTISIPNKELHTIIINFKEKKTSELKYFKSKYLVEDTLSIPKWHISNDTKLMNNILCRKATTNYKGRLYEVWFTNEYPVMTGPWKLTGLPGLIVLAYDNKNEVYFEATEIKKVESNVCKLDNSVKNISKNEYDIIIKKWRKDYEERLKSMGNRNIKFDVKFNIAKDIEISD